MKLSQEQIDKIYKIFQWITLGILVGGFILLVLLPIGKSKWSWGIWFGLFLVSAIIANIVKHWATDEEAEEFKKAVKDAVHEAAKETGDLQTIVPKSVAYDPFSDGVPDEQKTIIKQLLHDLPSHHKYKDCISMSDVSRYLTALVDLNYISSSKSADRNSLRIWVEQVTGKQAPEQFRFNEAFPSNNKSGIKKAKDKIEQVLKV